METIFILAGVAILQAPQVIKVCEKLFSERDQILIWRRWLSILLMLPAIISSPIEITIHLSLFTWLIVFFNANIILNVIYFFSKTGRKNTLPNMHLNLKNNFLFKHLVNAHSWFIYLSCYEILLRLILMDELMNYGMSLNYAMVFSFAFYVALHFPQGKQMTFASIPFGILAAVWISITGSIIPVILLHWISAVGYDYIASYNEDDIKYENTANRIYWIPGE